MAGIHGYKHIAAMTKEGREVGLLVEMKGIYKEYPGVQALSDVDFTLMEGEIHSLCGENGAGKSTLIKILTGFETKDRGEILFLGHSINPQTTAQAQEMGISTVYQEVNLCSNLSVAENIYVGREPLNRLGLIDGNTMRVNAQKAMARLGLELDVSARLDEYSVAIQQMVAISRALDMKAKVLVLDEPTSSLDSNEVANLFSVMRKLKKQGIGIIFISHFFEQVFEISDRITVLRNGKHRGTWNIDEIDRHMLVQVMLGKELAEFNSKDTDTKTGGELFCEISGIGKKGYMSPVSVKINKGTVVGFAGLLGSGRTETVKMIFGIERPDSGITLIEGKNKRIRSPRRAILEGMAFCPENRKTEGLILNMSVKDNIVMALQAKRGLFHLLNKKKQEEIAKKYIQLLQIATPGEDQLVGNLSGGNQQKVLVARWLATDPDLLLLDEPTRGIDVGAKAEIMELVLELAGEGKSVVFISSELSEVVRCSNTVYVFKDKNIIEQLDGQRVQEGEIMHTIATGSRMEGAAEKGGTDEDQ